ncbi:hypothetical protein [Pelagibius sp.]|uniref:hypothetical protein n=1 Tax=Pelagibius sp. TaxID=1931238 RepID=UPI003BB0797A
MYSLPDVITHNYDPDRGAFRNICNLPPWEAETILSEIRNTTQSSPKENYLRRRLRTERWLYAERTRKCGKPYLKHPIYFFLGDFADGRDPARPESLVLPLASLPPEVLTFTYPDSMASLPLATEAMHSDDRKPYHGQVFTLAEIKAVVAQFGVPSSHGLTAAPDVYDRFIEVQVWDDRPLRQFLVDR